MNNGQIEGLSCKQSSPCPCTNKIAENHIVFNYYQIMQHLQDLRNEAKVRNPHFSQKREKY